MASTEFPGPSLSISGLLSWLGLGLLSQKWREPALGKQPQAGRAKPLPYPGGQQLWAGSCCCYGVSPALPFSWARDATESLCCGQRGWPERRAHCIQVPQARIDSLDQQMPLCVASAGSLGIRQLRGQGDDGRASVQTWGQCQDGAEVSGAASRA